MGVALDVKRGNRRREGREEAGIGQADREVAQPLGVERAIGLARRGPHRRPWRDAGATSTFADHEPAVAEDPVGRVDRRRARPEGRREGPYGREGLTGRERALPDRRLGAGRDLAGRRPNDLILF